MSELIDREALKEAVKRYADEPIKKKDRKCQAICLDMLGTIDAQPTIDAVEVVRCGECKWFIGVGHYCKYCREKIKRTDGYCSYGERRDNNG